MTLYALIWLHILSTILTFKTLMRNATMNAVKIFILIKLQVFHLFPYCDIMDECSHGDDTNTQKHVVFSHCHKLLSV